MEVFHKLVETTQVDYGAKRSLFFGTRKIDNWISFAVPIESGLFTSSSTRGADESEHVVTETCY